jgi:hypothetical protein
VADHLERTGFLINMHTVRIIRIYNASSGRSDIESQYLATDRCTFTATVIVDHWIITPLEDGGSKDVRNTLRS